MGLEILHPITTIFTICVLIFVLWADWVSQSIELDADTKEDWDWTGSLREITKSNRNLDSNMYSKQPALDKYDFNSGFNQQFDNLYKGGATAMTLLIVLVIFSTVWLIIGIYNEIKRLCGQEKRYPFFIVVIYHASVITISILSVVLWGMKLNFNTNCEVDLEEDQPSLCI
jgi:hypothetical protein